MAVSILHTADCQLGKPFGRAGDEARVRLRAQRFETVERLGVLAAERRVDAVLVAGDVFDNAAASDDTIRGLIAALESFDGPWVLLPGNHDPVREEGVWTRVQRFRLRANVIIATQPAPIVLAGGRLVVLPAPLSRSNESADLTAWFDGAPAFPGAVRIGLAHGSILGRLPAEADAKNPIAEDRAARGSLDYLALGDWHGMVRIDARTWYSGTPEPDRPKDNDPGNVLVVRIERPGAVPEVEPVAVGYYRWHDLHAAVHGLADVAVLSERVRSLPPPLKRHVIDLRLDGAIDLAGRAALEDELKDLAVRLCDLRVNDTGLISEPSDADLQRMGEGFVATAVARLCETAKAADPDVAANARLALQILYLECMQMRAEC